MAGTWIAIILLIILIITLFKNWKQGIILYVIFSLISPNINFNGIQLSFEILAFFPFILLLLLKNRKIFSVYRKRRYKQVLWLYFLLVLVSSLLAMIKYNISLPVIPLFGYFRIFSMIYILQALFEDNSDYQIEKIIAPVLYVNFFASVVQLIVPSSVQVFYDFYFKSSLTPLNEVLRIGYFNRAYGTFGTPVLLGIFSLFAFALYLGMYIEKKEISLLKIKIIISVIIGIMALSKTTILGIPIILTGSYLLMIFGVTKLKNKKIIALPIIIISVSYVLIQMLISLNIPILYYLRFLKEPFRALTTRYDSDIGILAETYHVIRENLFLGVGPNKIGEAFLGDSMYVTILYTTGIIGVLVYFGNVSLAIIKVVLKRKTMATLCGMAFLLAGLAAPIHFDYISAVFLAYLFLKAEERKLNSE